MFSLFPHHGLKKWLIITKMNVDAAAGGALMNKNSKNLKTKLDF